MNAYAWSIFTSELQDKYKFGIELAEKAVQLDPEAAHIWDTLAWLYFAEGNNLEAISAMEKAVEIDSQYNERLENLKTKINKKRLFPTISIFFTLIFRSYLLPKLKLTEYIFKVRFDFHNNITFYVLIDSR
jgi:tetratricopeptide (TPR) repeat protein